MMDPDPLAAREVVGATTEAAHRRQPAAALAEQIGRARRAVIREALDEAEDRALEQQRRDQLRELDLAMLGVRRLLLVDQAPDLLEDLPSDDAGEKTEP